MLYAISYYDDIVSASNVLKQIHGVTNDYVVIYAFKFKLFDVRFIDFNCRYFS